MKWKYTIWVIIISIFFLFDEMNICAKCGPKFARACLIACKDQTFRTQIIVIWIFSYISAMEYFVSWEMAESKVCVFSFSFFWWLQKGRFEYVKSHFLQIISQNNLVWSLGLIRKWTRKRKGKWKKKWKGKTSSLVEQI